MGTNFNARLDLGVAGIAKGIGRSIDIHIGKSSVGWRFLFHCYQPADDTDKIHPRSIEEWRTFLARPDVTIVDEYGREVDKREFWKRVEGKQSEKRQHDGGDPTTIADVVFHGFS